MDVDNIAQGLTIVHYCSEWEHLFTCIPYDHS